MAYSEKAALHAACLKGGHFEWIKLRCFSSFFFIHRLVGLTETENQWAREHSLLKKADRSHLDVSLLSRLPSCRPLEVDNGKLIGVLSLKKEAGLVPAAILNLTGDERRCSRNTVNKSIQSRNL